MAARTTRVMRRRRRASRQPCPAISPYSRRSRIAASSGSVPASAGAPSCPIPSCTLPLSASCPWCSPRYLQRLCRMPRHEKDGPPPHSGERKDASCSPSTQTGRLRPFPADPVRATDLCPVLTGIRRPGCRVQTCSWQIVAQNCRGMAHEKGDTLRCPLRMFAERLRHGSRAGWARLLRCRAPLRGCRTGRGWPR